MGDELAREAGAVAFGALLGAVAPLEREGGRVAAGFLAEEEPVVRVGALDRLAISREYP